jgi:hypothetical protein
MVFRPCPAARRQSAQLTKQGVTGKRIARAGTFGTDAGAGVRECLVVAGAMCWDRPMDYPLEQREQFGFLAVDHPIVFKGGAARPLPDLARATAWVEDAKHVDGFIYPPTSFIKRRANNQDPASESGQQDPAPVPKTERPALIHLLPMSHLLTIEQAPLEGHFLRNDGAFLIHLLAYLFGTRLHFKDMGVDGRIPTTTTHHLLTTPQSELLFLSHAYQTWRAWPGQRRRSMTNILYMNSRSPCHEWDWERFTINYMVFDAIYELATHVAGVRSRKSGVTHGKRYDEMRATFGLADDRSAFDTIAALRNDLFHEALWDGTPPGESGVSQRARQSVRWLREINHRLIPAVLGFTTRYTSVSCMVIDACIL